MKGKLHLPPYLSNDARNFVKRVSFLVCSVLIILKVSDVIFSDSRHTRITLDCY